MIISMNDGTKPNIDIGRALQFADIIDDTTFPIEKDAGEVYCYLCQRNHHLAELTPLTQSSGVFTAAVTCENDSPVYLCLTHIPYIYHPFEAFTPEVQTLLSQAQHSKPGISKSSSSNEEFVTMELMSGNLDGEEAEQALQALNGMSRED